MGWRNSFGTRNSKQIYASSQELSKAERLIALMSFEDDQILEFLALQFRR